MMYDHTMLVLDRHDSKVSVVTKIGGFGKFLACNFVFLSV